MAFYSTGDLLVLVAGCVLFAVHVAKVVRDTLSPEWRERVHKTLAKLARLMSSRFGSPDAADEFAEEVAARLLARQLSQFQGVLKVLLLFFIMPSMALAFRKVILGLDRFHQTAGQDAIIVLTYTALLLADCCPRLVNKWSLDASYAALMGGAALYITPPFCDSEHFLTALLLSKMLGALLSFGRMSLPAVVFWNGVTMACEYWANPARDQSGLQNFFLLWPVALSFMVRRIESRARSELRKDITAAVMQHKLSAGDALSAMFYDVVVELDRNLCIAAPTPKLAAFLLRSTPVSLERTPFENLLQDEEDRARFRNLLCPEGGPAASSFVELAHARMRGGSGTIFQVELFGYRFLGPCGHQHYLVGVRDAGDFERGGVPIASSSPQPEATSPFDDVVAVIDPYRANYPILSCTPFFRIRIMPAAEGTCLLPWVINRNRFEAWIQEAVNWYRAGFDGEDEPSDPPEESFAIAFRPRGRSSPMRTGAQCTCKVKCTDDSGGEEPWDDQITVEFAFTSIVQTRQLERVDGASNGSSSSGTPRSSPRMSLGAQLSGRPTVYGARARL